MAELQSPLGGDGDNGVCNTITGGNTIGEDMGRRPGITDKCSGNSRNPATGTEACSTNAMDAKNLQPPTAKKFNAPAHAATRASLVDASGGHGRSLAPIGEVGGEIIMKGGCPCLMCVGKEIRMAKQQKASASTIPNF